MLSSNAEFVSVAAGPSAAVALVDAPTATRLVAVEAAFSNTKP